MPALLAFLLLSLVATPIQDDEPKPVLSQDPLTAEQIAVYRAMLADYTKDEDGALNIANVTDPFGGGLTDPALAEGCPKEGGVPPKSSPTAIVASHGSVGCAQCQNGAGGSRSAACNREEKRPAAPGKQRHRGPCPGER